MKRIGTLGPTVCGVLMFLAPVAAWASGGEKQGKLVHVADTRNLAGFNLYIANLYNTNRLLFTLEAVLLTALMGLMLGLLMDWIVGLIGLDLSKREGKE
ncbi:MAG: DVU0150 family protein [Acidobacteriota bacterium]